MCTKIQKEFELSQRYELEKTGSEDGLVALTEDNVAKVEAMIRTDSNYRMSPEDQEKSPYWILALGKHLRGENCEHKIEDVIKNVVEKIKNHPLIPDVPVHGLIIDIVTGELNVLVDGY